MITITKQTGHTNHLTKEGLANLDREIERMQKV